MQIQLTSIRFLDMQIFDVFIQDAQNVFALLHHNLKFIDIIQINEDEKQHKIKIFKNMNHIDTAQFENFNISMNHKQEVRCENQLQFIHIDIFKI